MTHFYIFVFASWILLRKVALCEQYLKIPYSSSGYFMEIKIQFNGNDVLLPVNLMNNFSWITKSFLFKYNDTYVVDNNQTIRIGISNYSAKTYKTSFGIPNNTSNYKSNIQPILHDYYIYIPNITAFRIYHLGVSFAHQYVHKNFSLIDLLYERRIISERSFTIVPNTVHENGTFYIGKVPSKILRSPLYKGECNVVNDSIRWKCNLHNLQIGDKVFNVTLAKQMKIEFQTSTSRILVPEIIADFFKETLREFISNGNCKVNEYNQRHPSIIECNNNIIKQLPKFIITINKHTYSFPFSKFIEYQTKDISSFLFRPPYEPKETDNQTITFGFKFISIFDSVTFNYETDTIQLYSNTIPITNSCSTIKTILKLINVLIGIGIIMEANMKIFFKQLN